MRQLLICTPGSTLLSNAVSSGKSEPPASSLKCRKGFFACALNWTRRRNSSTNANGSLSLRVVSVREAFHEELHGLTTSLSEMCELAGRAMERATGALLQADLVLAEQVITELDQIAPKSAHIEDDAFKLLALQAPVAGDLRVVVSSLK